MYTLKNELLLLLEINFSIISWNYKVKLTAQ